VLKKSRIRHVPADQVTIIPVKETQPKEIMTDEFKRRAEENRKAI
jgi:hypothetical protein